MLSARDFLRRLSSRSIAKALAMSYRVTLLVVAALSAAPANAHHSFAAFDMDREVSIEGVVASYVLSNPHAHLTVKVPPGTRNASQTGTWDIEGAAANIMRRQGWNAETFKRGDRIKLVGHPLKSGDRGISLFYVIRADGTHLYQDIARPRAAAK
jgi:Family of unknown function (DUF6152)